MNVQRCLEILREVKDVAFATVDEKGLPVCRGRAGTAAGRTCRQRRTAGLHENQERFLGYPFKIATFA